MFTTKHSKINTDTDFNHSLTESSEDVGMELTMDTFLL